MLNFVDVKSIDLLVDCLALLKNPNGESCNHGSKNKRNIVGIACSDYEL